MSKKVLVVDDEHGIAKTISYALEREGFTVECAYDGLEALKKVEIFKPKVIILDLMMPEMDGYQVCRKLEGKNIGIIMLTAKNDIVDKLLGLEFGADDYLTKPFDIREVVARVKSLFRRIHRNTEEVQEKKNEIKINSFVLNKDERTIKIEDNVLFFTAMEFDLIYLLLSNINKAYSREQLLNTIWGMDYIGVTRTVDTHVQRVRKKLGKDYQGLIQTVHGVGYKGVNIFENRN